MTRRVADLSPRERLVFHVQELERVELLRQQAVACLHESFEAARRDGYDPTTLKVVLRLRKMTPEQRRERRALEAIYLAALGMLEGDPLTDEARRRLDPSPAPPDTTTPTDRKSEAAAPDRRTDAPDQTATPPPPPDPPQAPLILKTPDEARQEGTAAAAAGKRVYDNPYPAGDPCRAAWDEGWCAQRQSHGMDTPAAYQRRSAKPPDKDDKRDPDASGGADHDQQGAA